MKVPSNRHPILVYLLIPIGLVAGAMTLRWLSWPVLGSEVPFIFCWPALIIAAWLGGFRAGFVATLLGALATAYFVMEPRFTLAAHSPAEAAGLALFVLLGTFLSWLQQRYHFARSAQRAAEQHALQVVDERELLRITLTSIGDAVIVTDPHGRVTFLNPVAEALTGWPQADALGRPLEGVFRIVNAHTRQPAENPAAHALRDGRVVGLANDTLLIARDGSEKAIDDSAAPVRDDAGRIGGAVLVFRDVTDRQRLAAEREQALESLRQSEARHRALAEQLAEADRHKNEFLATLAHELRNPLAALRAAVELLTQCMLADPDAATAADILVRQADSLDRLTADLLDLARISQGALLLNREPVPLERIVQQALEAVRPALQARRHELSVTLPPEPVWLEADALRVIQALVNLLDNAAKYTPPGGRITLAASREGDSAVLRVRDNGIGIPPDELPRLFGLFTRLSATVDKTYAGMGIGLALVRNLVELHGGSVEVLSEGRNKGSEFVVRLPARAAPPVAVPPPPVESPAAPPCRVVLADDSDGFAASCSRLLRRRGHEVFLAGDGEEAVKLVNEARPDVLLLDIRLPGLDGYEVARRLRSAPGLEGLRIVGITGYGDEQHRHAAEQAGFDELLTKPLRLADLERVLAGRTNAAAAT